MSPGDVLAAALPHHERACDKCGEIYLKHPGVMLKFAHERICRNKPKPTTEAPL